MIGAIIGAGASLLGGLLNRKSNEDAAEKNIAFQRENAARQEALQREFAQSGIQWKTQDAIKAGIHPLYAMGANTVSYSPSTVGNVATPDTSMGSAVASAGQDISRAMSATQSQATRETQFTKSVQDLTLTKMGLENELLASQIAKQRAQIGPPMPTLSTVGGFPVKTDDIKQAPDTMPAKAIIRPAGIPLNTNPRFSDAQDVEDRYGETVSDWVVGPLNLLGDGYTTAIRRWPTNEQAGAYFKPKHNDAFIRATNNYGRR